MIVLSLSDEDLARASVGSVNGEAFNRLLEQTHESILSHLAHKGVPFDQRDDIAQQVLFKVARDFPRKRFTGGVTHYSKWLAIICDHTMRDDRKATLAKMRDVRRTAPWAAAERSLSLTSTLEARRHRDYTAEDIDDVREAVLHRFGEDSKEYRVLDLRLKGHSVEDIGRLLGGISERAVKRYTHVVKDFLNARDKSSRHF